MAKEKKLFKELKENDIVYRIRMDDCELSEDDDKAIEKLSVVSVTYPINIYVLGIMLKGGDRFSPSANSSSFVQQLSLMDEVELSFEVYATTRDEAIEEARTLVSRRMNNLSSIKRRINDAETNLILADSTLDVLSTIQEEEPVSEEEFAAMALS